MSNDRQKGPDEMYCRSCGEPIKKAAEICPECGVRNTASSGRSSTGRSTSKAAVQHDPSQFETTVSDSWWYGILASVGLWVVTIAVSGNVGGALETVLGLGVLGAWVLMPVAIYFDTKYVRANSNWNPSAALWIIGSIVWLINIVVGSVYLYRRHETVGEP